MPTTENSFRAAVAAEVALTTESVDTVAMDAGEAFTLADSIAKAEAVGEHWVLEIPLFGSILEELAKRKSVSVFHVDAVPGSLFATTEKLAPGKSSVLVADGVIGSPAPEPAAEPEATVSKRVTKLLKTAEERYVLGVVLEPETVDSQGDIYSAEEVRKAAHGYMEAAGNLGKQHSEIVTGKLKILETYIAPVAFEQDGQTVSKGTWLMGIRVVDDDLWSEVKKGSFTGFSIGGSAVRTPES